VSYKIFVLTNGWVLAGRIVNEYELTIEIDDGVVIRTWGTEHGLGQLAITGPTNATVFDPFGVGRINRAALLYEIDCRKPLS
jgi:hypothetical protein